MPPSHCGGKWYQFDVSDGDEPIGIAEGALEGILLVTWMICSLPVMLMRNALFFCIREGRRCWWGIWRIWCDDIQAVAWWVVPRAYICSTVTGRRWSCSLRQEVLMSLGICVAVRRCCYLFSDICHVTSERYVRSFVVRRCSTCCSFGEISLIFPRWW